LDWQVIKEKLEELLEACANHLEREWPAKYAHIDSSRIIQFTRMRVAINAYAAIMWLVADIPEDPRRKPLVLSVAPLVRSLFEELMSLIFVFQNYEGLIQSFILTNYTEISLELEHAKKYHGDRPEWQSYINKLDQRRTNLAASLGLTSEQSSNPLKNLGRWPTPGKMINILKLRYPNSTGIEFMEFVRSWIYRTLSGDTHLNFDGLLRRGSYYAPRDLKMMFGEKSKELHKDNFETYKMEMIWTTLTLLLSIVSETEGHFRFGLATRAEYLWRILVEHSDLAKEFFDRRYRLVLSK